MKSISVIIPIYNSQEYLNNLLAALNNQKILHVDVEILLIDNDSSDNSSKIIKDFLDKKNNFQFKYFFYDKKSGSYAARNFGVEKSKNEILVFTDSDCIPESNWLYNITKNIQDGTIISGKIDLLIEDNNNMWEIFDKYAHLNNDKYAIKNKVATANMAVLKTDFLKVGYFSEIYSGGDHEWSLRANKAGLRIKYYDDITVRHPTRKSFEEILKKNLRIAYGRGKKHNKNNKKLYSLVIMYMLKIFNLKTNLRYSKVLKKHGFSIKDIIRFNMKFMKLRVLQINAAIKGYKCIDVRNLGIK